MIFLLFVFYFDLKLSRRHFVLIFILISRNWDLDFFIKVELQLSSYVIKCKNPLVIIASSLNLIIIRSLGDNIILVYQDAGVMIEWLNMTCNSYIEKLVNHSINSNDLLTSWFSREIFMIKLEWFTNFIGHRINSVVHFLYISITCVKKCVFEFLLLNYIFFLSLTQNHIKFWNQTILFWAVFTYR